MSRYKDSNKYKIYGEDAILAARFDKYLDATLRNCRADYLKALSKRKQQEIPYEDLPDAEKETVQKSSAADDEIESLLFWEALKTHLHLLTPKECETMICLYIKRLWWFLLLRYTKSFQHKWQGLACRSGCAYSCKANHRLLCIHEEFHFAEES